MTKEGENKEGKEAISNGAKFFASVFIVCGMYCVISLINWNTKIWEWDNFTQVSFISFSFWGLYHVLKEK